MSRCVLTACPCRKCLSGFINSKTAVCNQITAKDTSVLDRLEGSGVAGVLAIIGDTVIRWGDLPRVVRARVDERLITAGRQPF